MDIEVFKNNSSIVDNNDNRQTLSIYLASNGVIPPEIFEHQKDIKDGNGKTVQDYLIENNIDVPEQWYIQQLSDEVQKHLDEYCEEYKVDNQTIINNPSWQNNEKETFAMYLAFNSILPPEQFNHNPVIQNKYGDTVAVYLEINNIEIPEQWKYDKLYKLKQSYTTAMRISAYGKIPSKYWEHDPLLSFNKGYTVTMYLARNGIVPPVQWQHDPNIRNNYGFTVQDYLQSNNINVPEQWKTNDCGIEDKKILEQLIKYCEEYNIDYQTIIQNPEQQNDVDKYTFAMYLADNSIIPQKQFLHDPNIKDCNNNTVRQKLQLYNLLSIPNEWYDDEYKQNHEKKPECVNDALYGIITNRDDNIKPEQQYENGYTVAMIYAQQGIIPPESWNHDSTIQNKWGYTVAMILTQNEVFNIPKCWQHDPIIVNKSNYTVAMIYAQNRQIPPKEWNHSPYIANDCERTVQDYLNWRNITVPDQWKVVDKQIGMTDEIKQMLDKYCQENDIENQQLIINYPQYQKCYWYNTFAVYLELKGIITPKEFQYDPLYKIKYEMTTAMIIADNSKIPSKYWQHKSELQDDDRFTVSMYLARKGIIPPESWNHDPTIQNKWGNTVAILLAANKILDITKQWEHDPLLKNKQQQSVAMIYAYQGIIPPQQWNHDKNIKDNSGFTVQDYLQGNNIEVPDEWQTIDCGVEDKRIIKQLSDYCEEYNTNKDIIINNPSWQDNKDKITFAMYLAQNSIIPPEQFIHNPNIKDKFGNTVQDYLEKNSKEVSEYWKIQQYGKFIKEYLSDYCIIYNIDQNIIINNPGWQDNYDKQTFAMYLVLNKKIIPPKQFEHNPELQNSNGYTIAVWLEVQGLQVPEQWRYDPLYKLKYNYTTAMRIALYGKIPSQCWQHEPELQDDSGWTVAVFLEKKGIQVSNQWQYDPLYQLKYGRTTAMFISYEGKMPSKHWYHDPKLQDNFGNTVAIYLAQYKIIPPEQWYHNPYITNKDGKTVQDYLIQNNIDVPEQWKIKQLSNEVQHCLNNYCKEYKTNKNIIIQNPEWQDNEDKETFATHLAWNGIVPPEQFEHDPTIQNKYGDTVAVYLEVQKLKVPEQWKYDPLYKLKDNSTTAMRIAVYGKIPSEYWEHDPKIQNDDGWTVAVQLERKDIETPQQWRYDPLYKLKDEYTTAIKVAENGKIVSNYWNHDPLLKDNNGNTVAMILAYNGIIPPQQWIHDKNMQNNYGFTVQDYLQSNNIEVPDEWKTNDCGVEDKRIIKYLIIYCKKYKVNKNEIISNPQWQDNEYKYTFAIWLVWNEKIIPPKQFEHDSKIQNKYGDTVAVYLEINNIEIPKQWKYDPLYKLKDNQTTAMRISIYGKIPSKYWNHNPTIQNDDGNTVAVYLEKKGIKIPQQWQYDKLYKLKYGRTTAMMIANKSIIPSNYWQHDPNIKSNGGFAVALFLSWNKIIPPKQWQTDPNIIYKYTDNGKDIQRTIALELSSQGVIPPQEWQHNPNFKDNLDKTVEDYLKENNIEVPDNWKTTKQKQIQLNEQLKQQLNQYCEEYNIDKQIILDNPNWQNNGWKETFGIYLAKHKIIPPKEFVQNPIIEDNYRKTIAIYLEENKLQVPEYCRYDPLYILEYNNNTTAMYLASCGIIPSQYWNHDPELQNNKGYTVAMLLAKKNIIPPQEWQHNSDLQDNYGNTVSMYLSQNGIIPHKQWEHQPNLQNYQGFTVQDYLQSNDIEIPQQWKTVDCGIENKTIIKYLSEYCEKYNVNKDTIVNNPSWQDNENKYTFAMYIAEKGKIPSKHWQHDPNIKGGYRNDTVRQYLQSHQFPIPNEWYDDEYKQDHNYNPKYVNDTIYGIIVDKPENINTEQQYENQWTVAMIYAYQGIIPSKQWEHNPNLQNKYQYTVAMLLAENGVIPPKEWEHNPELKDNNNNTVSLNLAKQGIIPPQQWYHSPYVADKYEKTVEDYLIDNNKKVPEQLKIVDKQIQISDEVQQQLKKYCKENNVENQQIIINYPQYQKYNWNITFASYLEINDIQVPKEFLYDPNYRLFKNQTTAMIIAKYGKIPQQYWQHDPLLTDEYGLTVAMYLARKYIPPKQWKHKPELQNIYGWTVAMFLAYNKIIPSKEWEHDPLLKNKYGYTVAMWLAYRGIIPPKQWMHDINLQNDDNESIRSNLLQNYYVYDNNQFIKLNENNIKQYIQTEILDNICQVCLNEGQQDFIKTTCNHRICLDCFKEMFKSNNYQQCPICRQEQWFQLIDQNQ